MQGINGLGHVAIKVTDLDRSLDYYVNKLGFPEMLRLKKDDGSVWLVYLRITDEQYLEVRFTDALDRKQSLNGLVRAGDEAIRTVIDGSGGLLQGRSLLFGALGEIVGGFRHLAAIVLDLTGGIEDAGHRFAQACDRQVEVLPQPVEIAGKGHANGSVEFAACQL